MPRSRGRIPGSRTSTGGVVRVYTTAPSGISPEPCGLAGLSDSRDDEEGGTKGSLNGDSILNVNDDATRGRRPGAPMPCREENVPPSATVRPSGVTPPRQRDELTVYGKMGALFFRLSPESDSRRRRRRRDRQFRIDGGVGRTASSRPRDREQVKTGDPQLLRSLVSTREL